MRRYTQFMNRKHLKKLHAIGEVRGLKVAQLVRMAVAEFIGREARRAARATVLDINFSSRHGSTRHELRGAM